MATTTDIEEAFRRLDAAFVGIGNEGIELDDAKHRIWRLNHRIQDAATGEETEAAFRAARKCYAETLPHVQAFARYCAAVVEAMDDILGDETPPAHRLTLVEA